MISAVFPAYNEEDNVVELHRRILEALKKTGEPFEIVAVDNASTDGTYTKLKTLSPITIIRIAYNIGQTAGLDAGIHAAKGDIIVTLDADLQNDPSDIPAMFKKIQEGYDLVAGWRVNRHDTPGRKIFSRGANLITRTVLGIRLHDYACATKMFRKKFLNGIHLYGEMHVFLAGIMHFRGARIVEMPVKHHNRIAGLSKHNFIKGAKDLADLFTIRFLFGTTRPLVLFGSLAFSCFALSGAALIAAIVLKIIAYANFAQTPLPLLVAFFGISGLMLFMMGLIAELVLRSYYETTNSTPYVIDSIEHQ
ncbi:MAG: glycosyltransferase family 2 protein [Patescibacteria group bacterium]|nr:glycosyltransferase family 2 protein [Patescibacteria group bacterium]